MKIRSKPRRTLLKQSALAVTFAACGLLGLAPSAAVADANYPDRPVRVVVNFPAGGAADQIARAITTPLSEAMGETFVVENKGGANGNIGGEIVARAKPDGYTLLVSSGGMVSINPTIYPEMSFDPMEDLTPVAAAARVLVFLEVNDTVDVDTAEEFIEYLKANPGKLSYSSPGNGSSPHLAGELFAQAADIDALHVPYRGGAPAMQDLLGGQVNFMFDPGLGLSNVDAGKLKMLAVGSPKRSTRYPDIRTLDEVGLEGFDADSYFGIYAPAGTPDDIIEKLNVEINKIVSSPDFAEKMLSLGAEPAVMTPDEFNQQALDDFERFGKLIKERNIMAVN